MIRIGLVAMIAASAACGRAPQSEACRTYVACVRALDVRDGLTTDAVRFEPDGDCWGGEKIADVCDRACTRGLALVREAAPGLACEGGAP